MDELDNTPSTDETPEMEIPAEETPETPTDDTDLDTLGGEEGGEDLLEGESTL